MNSRSASRLPSTPYKGPEGLLDVVVADEYLQCFPIALLSLLWSGDPDDFRVTRPMAFNVGLRSGRGRYSGALEHAGPHFLNIEQHQNHSDSHRVALNRPLRRGTQPGRPGEMCGRFSIMRRIRFWLPSFCRDARVEILLHRLLLRSHCGRSYGEGPCPARPPP
jgi:hypothetical protein